MKSKISNFSVGPQKQGPLTSHVQSPSENPGFKIKWSPSGRLAHLIEIECQTACFLMVRINFMRILRRTFCRCGRRAPCAQALEPRLSLVLARALPCAVQRAEHVRIIAREHAQMCYVHMKMRIKSAKSA